jgi:ABC-2 type transport system permease protein
MFLTTLSTEFLKLRRSKVTWGTLVAFSAAPAAIALFMWIVREPGRAKQLGLLGTKAQLSGLEATWASYLSMLTLMVGVGGMLLLAFIVAYVFGREYAEGTAKNLLALPVGRHVIVGAKFVVAAAWWLAVVAFAAAETFAIGALLGLPGFSAGLAAGTMRDVALVAAAAFLLAPPIAWITVLGRGYMPPIGFALATLALGDVFSHTGWASWFPWSVVPLFVGAVGARHATIATGSMAVVALTFAAGIAATMMQLRLADNAQ